MDQSPLHAQCVHAKHDRAKVGRVEGNIGSHAAPGPVSIAVIAAATDDAQAKVHGDPVGSQPAAIASFDDAGLTQWPRYDAKTYAMIDFSADGKAVAGPDPWKKAIDATSPSSRP